MTRNQSVRGQRWTCFAHYSNVLFDSCIDLWLRYQKKKEDTAAAKMVGEDVGEDRLHSVDLLLELMPHSYAVHSDWCKVIMVLAFSEVHFFLPLQSFFEKPRGRRGGRRSRAEATQAPPAKITCTISLKGREIGVVKFHNYTKHNESKKTKSNQQKHHNLIS